MPALQVLSARHWRNILILLVLLGWQALTIPFAAAQNPTDNNINLSVWQQLYGVPADSALDMNGMMHSDEATAGIVPGKGIRFQVSTFSTSGGNALLTFSTVMGKYYTVQGKASLLTGTWSQPISGVTFIGDGTIHTLTVTPAQNPGPYFRVVVQDNSTANDQVSDWAKAVLGYSTGSSISSQSQYDHTGLANALAAQNVVTVVATSSSTTQPPDGVTAPSNLAAITFNRSGYQLFSAITVPITISGNAVSGTDYAALPGSVNFPVGVNTVTLTVTPLYNPNRNSASNQAGTGSCTLTVAAQAGGGYTLGTPSSASVTIYPATQGGTANGTGLTGQFWLNSNAAYTNGAGLGLYTGASNNYTFTPTAGSTTSGTIVVTYPGTPAVPYYVGQLVNLSFTSGLLSGDSSEWNTSYTSSGTPPTWQYTITALGANGPNSFTVPITTNGVSLPATTATGNVNVAPYAARSNATNFGGIGISPNAVTYTYSTGTHIATISYTGTPAVAFTNGGTATLQFTSGSLYTTSGQNGPGVYDGTYTTSSVTFNSGGSGSGTFTVPMVLGSFVPSGTGGNATLTPFFAPVLLANSGNASSRIDPTVDFIFGTGQPPNTSLQTGTNQNWAARWDTYLVAPITGTTYTFQVQAFDGARVYLNGNLIIDAWAAGSSSFTPAVSAPQSLTAGTIYQVRVEYYHLDGATASINLQWEKPGDGSYGTIPDTDTFQSSSGTGLLGWTGLYWTNTGAGAPPSSSAVTISVASPAVINWTNHGLSAGASVVFSTSGSLPTGLTAGTPYYVLAAGLTANSFEVSTAPGGSPVATSGSQSGTQTASAYVAPSSPPSNTNVAISVSSPAMVTWASHGLGAGTPVVFSASQGGSLPAGLTPGAMYDVLAAGLTANSFEVGSAPGGTVAGGGVVGAPVNTTAPGTGTYTAQTFTNLFSEPHYSDFPSTLSNLSWPSQPSAQVASANNFSIRWDGYLVPGVSTVTISNANPAVVTWTAHGLTANTPVVFNTTGALPNGLDAGTTYYVVSGLTLTANTFEVSTTPGGSAVATNSGGSGTQMASVVGSTTYTFNVQASDGARVYLDSTGAGITNSKIIDAWTVDSSATTPIASSPITLTAGQPYRFRVEYFQTENSTVTANGFISLNWQQNSGALVNIPPANFYRMDPLTQAATSTAGLWASFYNNATLTDPPLYAAQDTNSPTFNGSNSATSVTAYSYLTSKPSSGSLGSGSNNNWSGRLTSYLKATSGAGNYQFQLLAQTAGQLVVDGNVVIPFTSGTSPASSALNWTANSVHSVEVDFFDVAANGEAILSWANNQGSSPVTISVASPAVVSWTAHGLTAGTPVTFTTTGALPTGLSTGTTYYVASAGLTANSFEVSTTSGGSALNTSGTQSGTQTAYAPAFLPIPTTSFYADAGGTQQPAQGSVTGSYYANSAFTGYPYFSDYQPSINYNKGSGAPGDSWSSAVHTFSATWDGYLAAATAGTYTFSLQAQYKARVYVNGTLVCDGWSTPGSSATTPVVGSISLPGGANARVPFHVDYENSTTGAYIYLLWQNPNTSSSGTVPNTAFYRDASTAQTGLLATYYTNSAQTPPYFYQVAENNSAEIDYFYGTGTPDPNVTTTGFTALWTGQVLPQYTEPYYFTVKSDDGARLFVNGQLVIDKWQSQSTTEWHSPPISLNAGDYYDIRLEYLNLTGNAEVHLNWYSADQNEQIIPQTRLFPTSTGAANNSGPTGVTSTTSDVYIAGSGTPYSYTITGSGSPSSYSASGLPGGLSLNGNVISGTPTTPGNYQFTVTTTNAAGTSSVVVNLLVASAVGDITREVYNGLPGSSVSDLQYAIASGSPSPTTDTTLTTLESTSTTYGANTGERLRGYFTAPATGNYYFWVAGSGSAADAYHNIAEFWLSDSREAVAKIFRCAVSGTTGTSSRVWNAQSSQQSPWLSLVGGQQYYFEILHNAGNSGSNSNVSVGWFLDPTGNSVNLGSPVSSTVNLAIASHPVVTWLSHGLAPGTPVVFSTTGALPTGLTAGTTYYVLGTGMTANSFDVSTTINGAAVNTSGSQSGNQTATSTRANPIANGSGPAAAGSGGIVPSYVLSPWDNPTTTTTPSTIYLATLAGSSKLSNIKGSGGAYVALNSSDSSNGILHVSYSGLTSGATAVQIYSGGTLLYDAGAQDKNYPSSKTSDGGYTWSGATGSALLAALQNGTAFIAIATANNPITVNNPYGELTGTFGAASGSQVAPSLPSYTSPSWSDDKSTLTAARFLTQATFGPSPSDMAYITANGCRAWLENQLGMTPTYTLPIVLNHLSGDPQNPYNDPLFFNAWWQNAITAPDQLRQRVAFALSEIMVASDVGPLNNNDRPIADYYDNIVEYCLGTSSYGAANFRTLLKQVSLTNAMGQYLNMQGNYKGSLITGLHANENYGREIMQLFSVGLYLRWNDGTLVLDSTGNPIATYTQPVITGMSHALTGWNYGQPLVAGSGPNAYRLPTGGPSTNYIDPMVLISSQHELGTKLLLDNVVLPPAIVLSQSDTSHDPAPPSKQITVETTDPVLGPGNTVFTTLTSTYDLYALQDFESGLNSIMNNPSVAPYICRQLIQRLVTSSPQPAYVARVVRAFRGERNIDGNSTGVVGDLNETIRAILLDPEARNITEAAAPGTASPPTLGFGKQREPLLRVTGPARAFPVTGLTAVPYRQLGGQLMMIGPTATPHRLSNSDTVLLDSFASAGGDLPYSVGYGVGNTVPSYSYNGTTKVATINAPGYQAGATPDTVNIQFTSGTLGSTSPYNTVQSYVVQSATTGTSTSGSFTVNITGAGAPGSNTSGNAFTPNNFTVTSGGYTTPSYSFTGSTATISLGNLSVGEQIYVKFTSGGLLGTGNDGVYTISNPTSSNCQITLPSPPGTAIASIATGNPCTITTSTPHKQAVGTTFSVTISGVSGGTFSSNINSSFTATSTGASTFTIADNCTVSPTPNTGAITLSGNTLIPTFSGGYTVATSGNNATITLQTTGNFDLNVGDQLWVNFPVVLSPFGAVDGLYDVVSAPGGNLLGVSRHGVGNGNLTAGTESTTGYVCYPLVLHAATRSGTCNVDFGTWNINNTTTNSTLDQSPVNSTTVFNFFYPTYAYPGAIAQAGMTTPEFQLTDASDTLNLTNAITAGILNAGNLYGYTSFFNGGGAIVMDLGPYQTQAQTQNSGIPGLVSTLGTLLCGGNLTSASQTTISNYLQNQVFVPISSLGTGASTTTFNMSYAHGLTTGTSVTISGITGGTFTGSINGTFNITVTSSTAFTVPVPCSSTTGVNLTNAVVSFNTANGMPTQLMRDRVRAILQLILTSAEYSIQK